MDQGWQLFSATLHVEKKCCKSYDGDLADYLNMAEVGSSVTLMTSYFAHGLAEIMYQGVLSHT